MGLVLGCGGNVTTSGGTGTGGAGGYGQTTATSSSSSTSASATTGAASSTGTGGITCVSDTDCSNSGTTCCGGLCVNTRNDIKNCGACGVVCPANMDYCDGTKCVAPPCTLPTGCSQVCCGDQCCGAGQLCCEVQQAGPSFGPKCTDPDNGTCPIGCPLCK